MTLSYTPAQAIAAINARTNGVWDNAQLVRLGPLGMYKDDVQRILDAVQVDTSEFEDSEVDRGQNYVDRGD